MLNFEKREWIVKQKIKGEMTNKEIADSQDVTRMTVNRIWRKYCEEGLDALKTKRIGRKPDNIPEKVKKAILQKRNKKYGIRKIEGLLKREGISISHNKIHRFLKEKGMVEKEPKKGLRKKYVRWERDHSNSMWQTDFCWQEKINCWLTAYLDDHSRFIVGIKYIKSATAEESIKLLNESIGKYGSPREILSDRGAQYYAVRGGESYFTKYLQKQGIDHILASVKKPTTTGKLERFWLTHNTERWRFSSLREFVDFYNFERPHMSLDYLTPYEVFLRDL